MDWLAGLLELAGVWQVGNKSRHGFLICLACNLLWIAVAFHRQVYGLIPVSIAMFFVNIRNFRKWGREA